MLLTDLTVGFSPSNTEAPAYTPNINGWTRLNKDLYLHSSSETAWIYIKQAEEETLTSRDEVIVNITVNQNPNTGLEKWDSRPGDIWLLKDNYSSEAVQFAITDIDVLFGTDAVDPRQQWDLIDSPLQLQASSQMPVAKLTVKRGREQKNPTQRRALLSGVAGIFKILQISDTHMVTGPGSCDDAVDCDGNPLPESVADPLTMDFIGNLLDAEKPNLVVLTGDQLHHDILDSQSALFKVVSPMVNRGIPYAAVFGNHDSEGAHALSREEQMSLYQELPYSMTIPGPDHIDGVGNYIIEVLGNTSSTILPFSTLYFLDSHAGIESQMKNPDYDWIKPSQIEWLTSTSQALRKDREKNKGKYHENYHHLHLAFFHIPFPEFAEDDLILNGGQRREPTEGPSFNSHFYDALVAEGVQAVGCGHDHINDFCALRPQQKKTGPWLCYGGGSGFGGYCSYGKERYRRRARVWELNTRSGGIKTWKRTEYSTERVDELLLVENGALVGPANSDTGGDFSSDAREEL